ncbi:MAG: pyruvate formate lyase family protein [Eubacteriales bacterium]
MIEILKYINENLDRKTTLEEMSRLSGYSSWHFCEKFKSYSGINFHDYVNSKRIQSAARDILSGQKTIDVAMSYGYSDSSGFNRAFLREYKCSPSEYRKNYWHYNRIYKESSEKMLMLTDRCVILKESTVDTKSSSSMINGQLIYGFVKGYYSAPKDKRDNRTLLTFALCTLLDTFEPIILENELIVGYNYNERDFEQNMAYINSPEDEKRLRDYLDAGILPSDKKEELIGLLKGEDKYSGSFVCNMPGQIDPSATLEMKGLAQEIASIGWCMTNNHSVIGYERVLRGGFSGIARELDAYGGEFHDSLKKVCASSGGIGLKYARKASELMEGESDPRVLRELADIKSVCERVPLYPARTFREAVQSLWFAHIINTWEDGINANSLAASTRYYIHTIKRMSRTAQSPSRTPSS